MGGEWCQVTLKWQNMKCTTDVRYLLFFVRHSGTVQYRTVDYECFDSEGLFISGWAWLNRVSFFAWLKLFVSYSNTTSKFPHTVKEGEVHFNFHTIICDLCFWTTIIIRTLRWPLWKSISFHTSFFIVQIYRIKL